MKPLKMIALLLVLVPALATIDAKPKKPYKLPAAFNQARYVYVEAVDGREFDARVDPEDCQAIADVGEALNKWKRYVPTIRRNEADLIFVVRKGRVAEAGVSARVGTGVPSGPVHGPLPGNGIGVSGAAGPPDDLLEVYLRNPDDSRGALLWQRTLTDGLNPPDLTLLKQLKEEVESAYPNQTASKTSKP